jgi:tetratricopeptide (TPR) repeat protein
MAEREEHPSNRAQNVMSGDVDHGVQAQRIRGGVHFYNRRSESSLVPRQLPPDVAHFTGREAELGKLDSIVHSAVVEQPSAVVISAIAGTAGMGKTSLAIHWAHTVRGIFPHGELYVNLRGYDPGLPLTAEQALIGFLRALDVPDERILNADREELSALFRSLLAQRRMLIVLDNATSSEQVRPLLPGSSTCVVVVTSRSRLSGLMARDGAHRISLDRLSPAEAVVLLRSIVGSERIDGELDAAVELSRSCCCLPLALRIAAERIAARPHLSVSGFVDELRSADTALEVLTTDDDEQTAVRSVFSWSYRTLPVDAARVFRLLGLFPGHDIEVRAAGALTSMSISEVRRVLDGLASVYLIEEIGRGRYRFHDLLRAYANERATIEESAVDRTEALRRVMLWYLHSSDSAIRSLRAHGEDVELGELEDNLLPLSFGSRVEALQWLDQESANLLTFIHYASETHHHALAWQLPTVLTDLLWRQNLPDVVLIYQKALNSARVLHDRLGELRVLSNLGDIHLDMEQFDSATDCFGQMLTISLEIGREDFEGWALNGFGLVHLRRRNWSQAIEYLRRAAAVFNQVENVVVRANALANLGDALREARQYEEAIECCHRSLAILKESDNRAHEATALRALGWIYLDKCQYEESIRQFHLALTIDHEFDNRFDEGRTQNGIGSALFLAGDPERAREAWLVALKIFEELGSPQATEVRTHLDNLPNEAG